MSGATSREPPGGSGRPLGPPPESGWREPRITTESKKNAQSTRRTIENQTRDGSSTQRAENKYIRKRFDSETIPVRNRPESAFRRSRTRQLGGARRERPLVCMSDMKDDPSDPIYGPRRTSKRHHPEGLGAPLEAPLWSLRRPARRRCKRPAPLSDASVVEHALLPEGLDLRAVRRRHRIHGLPGDVRVVLPRGPARLGRSLG